MKTLLTLCTQIEAGYGLGMSMSDDKMMELVEELSNRTGEIKSLIDPYTSADDAHQAALEAGSATPIPRPEDKPVPHADLIRAVLDGKSVQQDSNTGWFDLAHDRPLVVIGHICTYPNNKYRLKPEPIVRYAAVFSNGDIRYLQANKDYPLRQMEGAAPGWKVLRLELDPDTLDVISAKTEAP